MPRAKTEGKPYIHILNRTQYASLSSHPDAPSTFGQSQPTPNSGAPVLGGGGPREVQLSLKSIFQVLRCK
jgi:hypothetical protein